MFDRLKLAAVVVMAWPVCAAAGENEAMRFAIFRGYTAAIEEACPSYFVYEEAASGRGLSPQDRAAAIAAAPQWREEMQRSVKALGCEAAARDALAFTDLSFREVWEYKQ